MNSVRVHIPAKALLFGEYGVLYGGKAIAVTFFNYCFLISIKIYKLNSENNVTIHSDFFPNKTLQFSQSDLNSEILKSETNIFFFVNLLKPWKEVLKPYKIEIHIEKSYSPSLGFGSSSALIAGISRGLWQLIYQNEEYINHSLFWKYIRNSIKNIQGDGSGYDVSVQLAASQNDKLNKKISLWAFQNQEENDIPAIKNFYPNENISNYGCFLSTNIYSDTAKAIHTFHNETNKLNFAKKHSELADWFIINHSIKNLKIGMKKSLQIALEQKIIPTGNIKFNNLLSTLHSQKIPYKSMGAGHGDCLWVLTNKKNLMEKCHIPEADIPFAFETYGTES